MSVLSSVTHIQTKKGQVREFIAAFLSIFSDLSCFIIRQLPDYYLVELFSVSHCHLPKLAVVPSHFHMTGHTLSDCVVCQGSCSEVSDL